MDPSLTYGPEMKAAQLRKYWRVPHITPGMFNDNVDPTRIIFTDLNRSLLKSPNISNI